jgi:ribosome-binding factor A
MEPHRAERVAEALRSELEEILNYELDDPRMTPVAITEVILTPDGRKARIRLFVQGTAKEADRTLQIIEKAKGYIRHVVAERVDVFRAPDLRFEADLSPDLREKADDLLRRVRKGRPRDSAASETAASGRKPVSRPQPAEKNPTS